MPPFFPAVLVVLGGCQAGPEAPRRPNILFAMADDISYPHMGAYGTSWVSTPAFDKVAREGLLFHRAYTPNAKCAPSRSIILTGRHSWQLGAAANHWPFFPREYRTWAEALADHGYHVGFTGKGWGPGVALDADGNRRELAGTPFQEHKTEPPSDLMSPNDYARNFEAFLATRPEGEPFAFWYGGTEPHRAYAYESGTARRQPSDVTAVPGYWPDTDAVRTDMLDYAFEIEHFDSHLGRMLALLEEQGELENTLVVVTADNGMPFPRVKGQVYEASNHMPLAVMWAEGIESPGREVDDFVSFLDLAPTFLEVTGLSEGESGMQPIEGRSFADLFKVGREGRKRDHAILGKERHDIGRPGDVGYPVRGIVTEDWLYLVNFEPDRWPAGNPETGYLNTDGSPTKTTILDMRRSGGDDRYWRWSFGLRPGEELYRIASDPDCLENLAEQEEHAELKESLRTRLFQALEAQDDPRMKGEGHVFDEYPYSDEGGRGFYERFRRGEELNPGWVEPSDFEDGPVDQESTSGSGVGSAR